jgi:hypothetical protein
MENNAETDVKKLVADAIAKFREEHVGLSYSQRHPELGKMVNCPLCFRRHRSVIVCQQVFTIILDRGPNERVVEERRAANTRKGVNGSQAFAKKRIRPHHSHKLLELVQLTQTLFPKYFPRIVEPEKAMRAARGEAQAVLSKKSRAFRRVAQTQQHKSRRINRGA